jgi:hypothetical protein
MVYVIQRFGLPTARFLTTEALAKNVIPSHLKHVARLNVVGCSDMTFVWRHRRHHYLAPITTTPRHGSKLASFVTPSYLFLNEQDV